MDMQLQVDSALLLGVSGACVLLTLNLWGANVKAAQRRASTRLWFAVATVLAILAVCSIAAHAFTYPPLPDPLRVLVSVFVLCAFIGWLGSIVAALWDASTPRLSKPRA